jgi:hypothetical protein
MIRRNLHLATNVATIVAIGVAPDETTMKEMIVAEIETMARIDDVIAAVVIEMMLQMRMKTQM